MVRRPSRNINHGVLYSGPWGAQTGGRLHVISAGAPRFESGADGPLMIRNSCRRGRRAVGPRALALMAPTSSCPERRAELLHVNAVIAVEPRIRHRRHSLFDLTAETSCIAFWTSNLTLKINIPSSFRISPLEGTESDCTTVSKCDMLAPFKHAHPTSCILVPF
jgi:hypothetical protein